MLDEELQTTVFYYSSLSACQPVARNAVSPRVILSLDLVGYLLVQVQFFWSNRSNVTQPLAFVATSPLMSIWCVCLMEKNGRHSLWRIYRKLNCMTACNKLDQLTCFRTLSNWQERHQLKTHRLAGSPVVMEITTGLTPWAKPRQAKPAHVMEKGQ